VLDPNHCFTFVDADDVKDLEVDFFSAISLNSALLFGGTLGSKSGGITSLALSPDGRMVASALTNGTILIYDTSDFSLARVWT